ncbi:MAG: hypothetical protein AB1696_01435 [Planctomycetota bacterium]
MRAARAPAEAPARGRAPRPLEAPAAGVEAKEVEKEVPAAALQAPVVADEVWESAREG